MVTVSSFRWHFQHSVKLAPGHPAASCSVESRSEREEVENVRQWKTWPFQPRQIHPHSHTQTHTQLSRYLLNNTVTRLMFACSLIREFCKRNKAVKLKGANIDTILTLIGIVCCLKNCVVRSLFAGRGHAYSRPQRWDLIAVQCACPGEEGRLLTVC